MSVVAIAHALSRTTGARRVSRLSKVYAEWVKRGLDKPGKSGKGLAAALGISETSVSRIHTVPPGKNLRRIQATELQKIAEYLEEDIPSGQNIVGTQLGKSPSQAALGSAQAVPLVRVSAVIAPSVWREVGVSVVVAERIPASPDPRVAGMKQYACKIEAEANRFAICVPYGDVRPKPLANDVVHVRRTRDGHYEDTLRTVRITNGNVRLQLEASKDKPIDFPAMKGGETIEIKGLVIGYFSPTPF